MHVLYGCFLVVALMLLRFLLLDCLVVFVLFQFFLLSCSLLAVWFGMLWAVIFVIFLMFNVVLVMFVDFHVFACSSVVDVNLVEPSYLESLPKKGLE